MREPIYNPDTGALEWREVDAPEGWRGRGYTLAALEAEFARAAETTQYAGPSPLDEPATLSSRSVIAKADRASRQLAAQAFAESIVHGTALISGGVVIPQEDWRAPGRHHTSVIAHLGFGGYRGITPSHIANPQSC